VKKALESEKQLVRNVDSSVNKASKGNHTKSESVQTEKASKTKNKALDDSSEDYSVSEDDVFTEEATDTTIEDSKPSEETVDEEKPLTDESDVSNQDW